MRDDFRKLLKLFPDAKPAHTGILLPVDSGMLHLTHAYSPKLTRGLEGDEIYFLRFCTKNEILRMRNMQNSHDRLLYIRAMAIVDNPRVCRVFDQRQSIHKNWSLTRYYNSKNTAKLRYVNALPDELSKIINPLASGLAMIKEPSASSKGTFTGPVILVSETLQYLMYFMNLAFYGIEFNIYPQDIDAALIIAIRVMLGVEALDFDLDKRCNFPPLFETYIKDLTDRQIEFVYGHEYAHYLLDHLTPNSQSDQSTTLESMYKEEYDADFFSITHVENSKYKSELSQAALHVFTYLEFLKDIIIKSGYTDIYKDEDHPPHSDRIENLMNKLDPSIQPSNTALENLSLLSVVFHDRISNVIKNKNSEFDLLTTYGSVYLPTYKNKILKDRIDY